MPQQEGKIEITLIDNQNKQHLILVDASSVSYGGNRTDFVYSEKNEDKIRESEFFFHDELEELINEECIFLVDYIISATRVIKNNPYIVRNVTFSAEYILNNPSDYNTADICFEADRTYA